MENLSEGCCDCDCCDCCDCCCDGGKTKSTPSLCFRFRLRLEFDNIHNSNSFLIQVSMKKVGHPGDGFTFLNQKEKGLTPPSKNVVCNALKTGILRVHIGKKAMESSQPSAGARISRARRALKF